MRTGITVQSDGKLEVVFENYHYYCANMTSKKISAVVETTVDDWREANAVIEMNYEAIVNGSSMQQEEEKEPTFEDALTNLLNRYSQENGSGTPDFILAKYLTECLDTFNKTICDRETWYGRLR